MTLKHMFGCIPIGSGLLNCSNAFNYSALSSVLDNLIKHNPGVLCVFDDMALIGRFSVICNRPDRSDQRLQETNKINHRLNNLSKDVRRELNKREWVALSVDNNRNPSADEDEALHEQMFRVPTGFDSQVSILEQRKKDAKIKQESAWRTCECLAYTLVQGNSLFDNLFFSGIRLT